MSNNAERQQTAPGVLVAGHYTRGSGYHTVRSPGTRDDWLIVFTIGGSGLFQTGTEACVCEKGDIVIVPKGSPHDYRTAGTFWEFHWAHFIPCEEWFGKLKLPAVAERIHNIRIRQADRFRGIAQAFGTIQQNQYVENRYRGMLALNVMEFIFISIADEYAGLEGRKQTDPRIEEVMRYLSARLDQSLKLDEIARHVSLSPSRLSHLYKAETGQTIMDTFLKMRLRHAADLLQYTSQRVEHIADQVGYSSVYYFSTAFKTYFGVSPTAYRRQHNGS